MTEPLDKSLWPFWLQGPGVTFYEASLCMHIANRRLYISLLKDFRRLRYGRR